MLAAANALSGDADLVAGTQLKAPVVEASKNEATSFKPYNPNEIIGSTAPGLPYIPPQPKSGCSALATIIRVVVAVVLAYVAPQIGYAMLIAGAGETVAQTVEIKQGYREQYNVGAIVVAVASAAIPNGGTTTWGKIGIAAMRAAGNYATSYLVNKALGIQDSFSWRGVATAAVTAAISQAAFGNLPTETAAAQSATGSMVSATAAFSWSRVAQAAVVAVKEAGKSIVRSGISYAVEKAIVGESHWNWGQVLSSAAVQAGSAFAGTYRQSGIAYNELKAQGLSEQDARLMAWGERNQIEKREFEDIQKKAKAIFAEIKALDVTNPDDASKLLILLSAINDKSESPQDEFINDNEIARDPASRRERLHQVSEKYELYYDAVGKDKNGNIIYNPTGLYHYAMNHEQEILMGLEFNIIKSNLEKEQYQLRADGDVHKYSDKLAWTFGRKTSEFTRYYGKEVGALITSSYDDASHITLRIENITLGDGSGVYVPNNTESIAHLHTHPYYKYSLNRPVKDEMSGNLTERPDYETSLSDAADYYNYASRQDNGYVFRVNSRGGIASAVFFDYGLYRIDLQSSKPIVQINERDPRYTRALHD